jgi:hypothetical protein
VLARTSSNLAVSQPSKGRSPVQKSLLLLIANRKQNVTSRRHISASGLSCSYVTLRKTRAPSDKRRNVTALVLQLWNAGGGVTEPPTFAWPSRMDLIAIVQWVLQVMFPSACSFIVLVFTVSLHVSAYMAIFRCVGYFIFICLKDSASLLFFLPFFQVVTLCMFSICVLFLCCFPSLFSLFPCVCVCVCVCLLALSLLFVSYSDFRAQMGP